MLNQKSNQRRNQKLREVVEFFLHKERLSAKYYQSKENYHSYLKTIEAGLKEKKSLPLLNTKRTRDLNLPKLDLSKAGGGKTAGDTMTRLVIDAGGTNLRVVEMEFSLKSAELPKIKKFETYSMPGVHEEITKEGFLDLLIDYLSPLVKEHTEIYFCFSYNIDFKNGTAMVCALTKEVRITGLVGYSICEEFLKRLHKRGLTQFKKVIVLNDTVATLLAGRLVANLEKESYATYLGLVWGTGFNVAYEEWERAPEGAATPAILNSECGNYDGWLMTEFDQRLDKVSEQPDSQLAEKKVSGYYLGDNFLLAMQLGFEKDYFVDLAKELEDEASKKDWKEEVKQFCALEHFPTSDLSVLLEDSSELKEKYGFKNDLFIELLLAVAEAVVARATIIVGTMTAGFILRSLKRDLYDLNESGDLFIKKRMPREVKVLINLDGSVVRKMPRVREDFEKVMTELLNESDEVKVKVETVMVENSPVVGSSVASY